MFKSPRFNRSLLILLAQEMKNYDFENGFFGGPGAQKNFVYSFYQTHQTPVSAQK